MKLVSQALVLFVAAIVSVGGCSSKPKSGMQCEPGYTGSAGDPDPGDGTCTCEVVTTTQTTPCTAPSDGTCCAGTDFPAKEGDTCTCSPRLHAVMCRDEGDGYCSCGGVGLGQDTVDSCSPPSGGVCCQFASPLENGETCVCSDATSCAGSSTQVAECDADTAPGCPAGTVQLTDCRNPPSSSGGGGGGGGTHCKGSGESCSSSGECCGHCELSDPNSSSYHECS